MTRLTSTIGVAGQRLPTPFLPIRRGLVERVLLQVPLLSGLFAAQIAFTAGAQTLPSGNPSLTEQIHFYHQDALGSVRAISDAQGSVVVRYDYLPFGEQIPASVGGRDQTAGYSGPTSPLLDNRRKFTGKERDAESGLDYFRTRYFSGAQGQFASADRLASSASADAPQSWNRYAYTWNNPLRFTDPQGETPSPAGETAATILGKLAHRLFGEQKGAGKRLAAPGPITDSYVETARKITVRELKPAARLAVPAKASAAMAQLQGQMKAAQALAKGKTVVGELWSWTATKGGFAFDLVKKIPGGKQLGVALLVGSVVAGSVHAEDKGELVDSVFSAADPGVHLYLDTFMGVLGPPVQGMVERMERGEWEKFKAMNPDATSMDWRDAQRSDPNDVFQ